MKIDILGTKYDISVDTIPENPKMEGSSGYIELYSKEIVLKDISDDKLSFKNLEEFKKKVMRHEITHAFFHESGMQDYCDDEKLVDWIALMLPKIVIAMNEANAI